MTQLTTLAKAITAGAMTIEPAGAVMVIDGKARLMATVAEAAELLNVSRKTVYGWISSGELPTLQLGGGTAHYRIAISHVLALANHVGTPGGPGVGGG